MSYTLAALFNAISSTPSPTSAPRSSPSLSIAIIVGIACGASVFLGVVIASLFFYLRSRRKTRFDAARAARKSILVDAFSPRTPTAFRIPAPVIPASDEVPLPSDKSSTLITFSVSSHTHPSHDDSPPLPSPKLLDEDPFSLREKVVVVPKPKRPRTA